ncbi:hypothetical protein PR048_008975 [Dryococelus australis]|uniref:HTH psq-type domain-containing protein n=1 Tax=Dryococelus australis TaxID=614101 RepID=A0ABQ9HZE9_9NEOP|nr:hypothetical protein PR048_008975 [Dryococelus australis]
MVKKYKTKNTYMHWSEKRMTQAKMSVLNGYLGTRAAASHFNVPYTILQRRVQETRIHRDFMNDPYKREKETDLVDRLTTLSCCGFGNLFMSVRRAVYHYAKLKNINTTFSDGTKLAGKD